MELDPEIYPHRSTIKAGECGTKPLKDLETWVKGGTFHKYGIKAYERAETVEEGIAQMRDFPAILKYEGELNAFYGNVDFSVLAQQAGDIESRCFSRPHFTPEDAAYAVLTLIEEHEREQYLLNLVTGLA